jgi:hypothetical protein
VLDLKVKVELYDAYSGQAKSEVGDLIKQLGRRDVVQECKITIQAVTLRVADGGIPPRRFLQLARVGRRKGVTLERFEHLFAEKSSPKTPLNVKSKQ